LTSSSGQYQRRLSRDALAALYRRTGALVFRRCRLILREATAAEDVMQDVYLRLMKYGNFSEEKEISLSYLYRMAERCSFDYLKNSRKEIPMEPHSELFTLLQEKNCSLTHIEASLFLKFFYQKCTPELQKLFLLYYLDDYTQEKIAEELGSTRRTIGKRLKKLDKIINTIRAM